MRWRSYRAPPPSSAGWRGSSTASPVSSTGWTRWVSRGPFVLTLDEAGQVTHRYRWGPAVDQILADESCTGELLFPLADHLVTPAQLDQLQQTAEAKKRAEAEAIEAQMREQASQPQQSPVELPIQ